MSAHRTVQRTPAIERRPPVANMVHRSAATTSPSSGRALQGRLGNQGTHALIARSVASGARDHAADGPVVGVFAPQSVQLSRATRLPTKVSKPTDAAELEAEETARKVMRMHEPAPAAKPTPTKSGVKGTIQRAQAAPSPMSSAPASPVNISGGSPLPTPVRSHMEPRFGASFSNVRVHTGEAAASQSTALNANAFTVGQHIFFGRDKFQPQSAGGQELIAHELTHTIQQGAAVQRDVVHRSAEVHVAEQVSPQVQRSFLGIPNPREYFAGKAAAIPGFTMLTVVIGFNPITNARVERNAGNILRGAIQLIPGGSFITDALNTHGVFDRVSAWASTQFDAIKDIGSTLWQDIENFLGKFKATDLLDPGGLWDQKDHRDQPAGRAPQVRMVRTGRRDPSASAGRPATSPRWIGRSSKKPTGRKVQAWGPATLTQPWAR